MKQFIIKNKINFLFVFLFFYFYYYPITTLNLKYRDDYIRSYNSTFAFVNEGRIVSKLILNFFSFTDGILISPLTQFLSIGCITFTIIYVADVIFKKKNLYSLSIVSLIFLNPFYLQNISFGYDSLPMTISTCCAVISATLILREKYYLIFTFCFAFLILFSYQATLGVYINCLLFILCKQYLENGWSNQSKIYTRAIWGISIYCISCLIYILIYPYLFIRNTQLVTDPPNIKNNILHTIYYIKMLFINIHYIVYITAITTLISLIFYHIKQYKYKNIDIKHIIFSLIVIPTIYITILLAAEGPSVLLIFEPNNLRVLIAISFIWVLSFYFISLCSKSIYYIFYILFSVFCFSTSYSYGIFLKNQEQFFTTLTTNIDYDISHTPHTPKLRIIALNAIPLAESNKRLTAKLPFFLYLYGEQDFDWLVSMKLSNVLSYSPSTDLNEICQSIDDLYSSNKLNIKKIKTDDYTLYFNKNNILIDFYTEQRTDYYCHRK